MSTQATLDILLRQYQPHLLPTYSETPPSLRAFTVGASIYRDEHDIVEDLFDCPASGLPLNNNMCGPYDHRATLNGIVAGALHSQ